MTRPTNAAATEATIAVFMRVGIVPSVQKPDYAWWALGGASGRPLTALCPLRSGTGRVTDESASELELDIMWSDVGGRAAPRERPGGARGLALRC